jgi:hypothetical protein
MNLNDLSLNSLLTNTCTSKTLSDEEIREKYKEMIKIGKEMDDLNAKAKQEIINLIKEEFPTVSDDYISVFAESILSKQHDIEKIQPTYYRPNLSIKLRDAKSLASINILHEECSDLTMDYIKLNEIIFKTGEK